MIAAVGLTESGIASLGRIFEFIDPRLVSLGALAALIAFMCLGVDQYVTRRRVLLALMTHFGERFIAEFERPLRQPSDGRPIDSRLRIKPYSSRLDILLAPNGCRRYPNLSDHKKNVEYDIARVVQALGSRRFSGGRVYTEGRWIVVPFRLTDGM
jgi:hypothetical protein